MEHSLINTAAYINRCGICGYALTGLPCDGRCPECGSIYGASVLTLWGRRVHSRRNTNFPPELQMFTTAIGTAFFLMFTVATRSWPLLVMAAIASPLIYLLIRDSFRPWQARLSAEGYGSRSGCGKILIHPWTTNDEINISATGRPESYILSVQHVLIKRLKIELTCTPAEVESLREKVQKISKHRVWLEKDAPVL